MKPPDCNAFDIQPVSTSFVVVYLPHASDNDGGKEEILMQGMNLSLAKLSPEILCASFTLCYQNRCDYVLCVESASPNRVLFLADFAYSMLNLSKKRPLVELGSVPFVLIFDHLSVNFHCTLGPPVEICTDAKNQ